MKLQEVFDGIYRGNTWNGVESASGPGSGHVSTYRVIPPLIDLLHRHGVVSVLDVGCGDGYWWPDITGISYTGIDVSEEAIKRARARHPDRNYIVGEVGDARMPVLPDLVFCRDAIQHLSPMTGVGLIASMVSMRPRWLLLSTYQGGKNIRIHEGGYYEPDLTIMPFSLGKPLETIPDGWGYTNPDEMRDPRKLLGLWRVTP